MSVNNISNPFGNSSGNGINVGGGISGDMLQSWAMLGANTKAYKALLKQQKETANGTSGGSNSKYMLNSDKLFNDYFDKEKGEVIKATYKPTSAAKPELDEEATTGDHLQGMRNLALASISSKKGLTTYQKDLFSQYYNHIASNLVTSKDTSKTEVETESAQVASMSTKDDLFRYLEDDQTFTIAGEKGEKTFSFGLGTSIEDVAKEINEASGSTGVTAEAVKNEDGTYSLSLDSVGKGKEAFIRVDQTKGDLFVAEGGSKSAIGKDAVISEVENEVTGSDTQAAIAAGVYKGKLFEDVSFTLQGSNGKQTFSFEKGTTAEEIVSAINDAAEKTGVKAEVIFNDDGEAEGIGLLAEKRGVGNYVQATMNKGSLFTTEGKTVSVAGSSKGKETEDGKTEDAAPAINSLQDLGQVTIDGVSYSFADLATGGKADIEKNPDAALAIIDQAIKEIYSGLAQIKDFDPKGSAYIPGVTDTNGGASAPTNTMEFDNYGSQAMTDWLNKFKPAKTS